MSKSSGHMRNPSILLMCLDGLSDVWDAAFPCRTQTMQILHTGDRSDFRPVESPAPQSAQQSAVARVDIRPVAALFPGSATIREWDRWPGGRRILERTHSAPSSSDCRRTDPTDGRPAARRMLLPASDGPSGGECECPILFSQKKDFVFRVFGSKIGV